MNLHFHVDIDFRVDTLYMNLCCLSTRMFQQATERFNGYILQEYDSHGECDRRS